MKKVKAALLGLVLMAASMIGIAAVAQPAGAITCSPSAYLGPTDLGWKDGYQVGVHGAQDTWCNGQGTGYGSVHMNFDLCPKNGNPCFSNYDTWMNYSYSHLLAFVNHTMQIGADDKDVFIDGYTERTYAYSQNLLGATQTWTDGSIQFGCMPHGRCYGWSWGAAHTNPYYLVQVTF